MEVTSPVQYQVLQRDETGHADIPIAGRLPDGVWDVEARYAGGSWTTIATAAASTFSGILPAQPQGRATLQVRRKAVGFVAAIASVPFLGIGEVLACGGQSNCSGFLINNQVFTGSDCSMLGNDYTWKACEDPTDSFFGQIDEVSRDTGASGARGSVWPLVMTNLSNTLAGVPVAFIPAALGGSSINAWQCAADHFDRSTLCGSMLYRARRSGVRAILWWQGESDAIAGMSAAAYQAKLEALADVVFAETGAPLIVCLLQNSAGIADAAENQIRSAALAAASANPHVLLGPDLSDISSEDDFHVRTDALAAVVAQRWADAIEARFGW